MALIHFKSSSSCLFSSIVQVLIFLSTLRLVISINFGRYGPGDGDACSLQSSNQQVEIAVIWYLKT